MSSYQNRNDWILPTGFTSPFCSPATACKARRSCSGSVFPRFSARRRIPAHALALKKYRRGTSPVSKTSDNEDATAALGNSEELSVKNSVRDPIPEFPQDPEDGSKRPPSIDRQQAGDVLEDNPSGKNSANNSKAFKRDVATRVIHPRPESCDGKGLAGTPENKDIWSFKAVAPYLCDIPEVRGLGVMMRQYGRRERLDLRTPQAFPSKGFRRNLWCADAGAQSRQFQRRQGGIHPPNSFKTSSIAFRASLKEATSAGMPFRMT